MCLAVPGKILQLQPLGRATVDMLGAQREVSLRLVPTAQVGDYVLVHAGFGIQVIDPAEAEETLRLVRELPDLFDEDLASAHAAETQIETQADAKAETVSSTASQGGGAA